MKHLRSTACIMKDASSLLRGLPVQVWKINKKVHRRDSSSEARHFEWAAL